MKFGPWVQRSRTISYQNPWIKVFHDEVLTPGGDQGIYGVVDFQNIAVGVLAVKEEQVLMVRQYRYPLGCLSLEIPEGGCPKSGDEDTLAAAKRELLEETGYQANEWTRLIELDLSNSITNDRAVVFLANDLTRVADPALESSEADLEVAWYSLQEVGAMLDRGEIRDAITVSALLKYQLMTAR